MMKTTTNARAPAARAGIAAPAAALRRDARAKLKFSAIVPRASRWAAPGNLATRRSAPAGARGEVSTRGGAPRAQGRCAEAGPPAEAAARKRRGGCPGAKNERNGSRPKRRVTRPRRAARDVRALAGRQRFARQSAHTICGPARPCRGVSAFSLEGHS